MASAARLMRARREEFARLNTLETGKLYTEALGEADVVAGIFEHYAAHAEELLQPVHLDLTTRRPATRRWCSGRWASCWP
jgi:succinate-semialdehyde dehydrogenase/glutarate-semialdehyde dehydrogenase